MEKKDVVAVLDGCKKSLDTGAPPHWTVIEGALKLAEQVLADLEAVASVPVKAGK